MEWLVQNWGWVLFLVLFAAGLFLMRRIPKVDIMGNVIFKINSKRGLRTMDRLGTRHSGFWKSLGDSALVLLFGGLGSAYVAYKREGRARSLLLAALTFFALFAYLGPNWVTLFPFGLGLSPGLAAPAIAAIAAALAYKLSPRLPRKWVTLAAFLLGTAFFASPYLLSYAYTGNLQGLALGLPAGMIGLPAIVLVSLLVHAGDIATGASTDPGINVGYPEIEEGVPVLKYAGTDVSIPLFPDILIAFIILLALHEGFHGMVARAQGIPLKNTGLLFASIVPLGAFVEPDEERFRKEEPHKRLRVYAVGSFANIFVIALTAFLIGQAMLSAGAVESSGFIANIIPGTPAAASLKQGEPVLSVGGVDTPSFEDFSEAMAGSRPGENLTVRTPDRTVTLTLGAHPENGSRGFVGLRNDYVDPIMALYAPQLSAAYLEPSSGTRLFELIKWVFFLNIMLGIINLLPIKPLDGGYVYDGFFDWIERGLPFGRRVHLARLFSQGFMVLILAVFAMNLLPYLF